MNNMVKLGGYEYETKYIYDIIDWGVRNGELIELREGEFFWTKKHFVKMVLGLSKIYPLLKRMNFYILAFKIQFTNIHDLWLESKLFRLS